MGKLQGASRHIKVFLIMLFENLFRIVIPDCNFTINCLCFRNQEKLRKCYSLVDPETLEDRQFAGLTSTTTL